MTKSQMTEFIQTNFSRQEILVLSNFLWMINHLKKSPFLSINANGFVCNLTTIHTGNHYDYDDAYTIMNRGYGCILSYIQKKLNASGYDKTYLVQEPASSWSSALLEDNNISFESVKEIRKFARCVLAEGKRIAKERYSTTV